MDDPALLAGASISSRSTTIGAPRLETQNENATGPLRHRRRTRPRRHGRGLQGPRAGPQPLRRDQGAGRLARPTTRRQGALPARSALAWPRSTTRTSSRSTTSAKTTARPFFVMEFVEGESLRPCSSANQVAARRPAREDHLPDRAGPRDRARQGRDPPRHQARQPDGDRAAARSRSPTSASRLSTRTCRRS